MFTGKKSFKNMRTLALNRPSERKRLSVEHKNLNDFDLANCSNSFPMVQVYSSNASLASKEGCWRLLFGKYRGASIDSVPIEYLLWLRRTMHKEGYFDELKIVKFELKRRSKGGTMLINVGGNEG